MGNSEYERDTVESSYSFPWPGIESFLFLQMNQQHFPGGAVPFMPPSNVPHARALMGYPMQPGVMLPPGVATSTAASPAPVKEDKNEEERVSTFPQHPSSHSSLPLLPLCTFSHSSPPLPPQVSVSPQEKRSSGVSDLAAHSSTNGNASKRPKRDENEDDNAEVC